MPRLPCALVFGVVCLALGCAPAPRTQVMVVVEADDEIAAASSELDVRVFAGPDFVEIRAEQTLGSADNPVRYPVHVALVPVDGDARRTYLVEVTARDTAGRDLVGARVISGFLPRRTLRLDLPLDSCCRDRVCPENETCRACLCSSPMVDPEGLEDFLADAGVRDAAVSLDAWALADAGLDAPAPPDAVFDAPAPPPDAVFCGTDCQSFGSVTSPGNSSLGHRGVWAPPTGGGCPAAGVAATADHGYGAVYFYSEGPSRNDLLLTPEAGITLVLYDVPSPTMGAALPTDPRACRALTGSSVMLSLMPRTTVLVVATRTAPGTDVGYRFSYDPI